MQEYDRHLADRLTEEAIMFARRFLAGKIHRATVTGAQVNYVGSITIDQDLLDASGIFPLEEVEVWNVMNGERLATYVLPGRRGSGEVTLNGAAARRAAVGDEVIISAFVLSDQGPPPTVKVVLLNSSNRVAKVMSYVLDEASKTYKLEGGEEIAT